MPAEAAAKRPVMPAVVLGIGLGAFVDGIVLHQVLGWHHMLSNVHPPHALGTLQVNTVWDGMFQVLAWFATALGIVLLWRAGLEGRVPTARRFAGGLLIGFALFNLVEGIVDHHLLRLHNVREVQDPTPWNVGLLVLSALLLVGGAALAHRGAAPPRGRESKVAGQ